MKVSQILKFVSLFISIVAVYFFIQVSTNGDGETGDVEALNSAVAGFIIFTKVMLYIIAAIIVVFMVLDVVKYPSKLKKMVIGVVAFLAMAGLAYGLADGSAIPITGEEIEEGSNIFKNVGAGIILSAVLGVIAFSGFVFDSVKSLLK